MKINDLIKCLEEFAPVELAEKWDNVGFLVGDRNSEVNKVLIALEITDEVIDEAIEKDVELIITHHPLIFKTIKNINTDSAIGNKIIKLIKNDIALYSAHTNLDSAKYGTTDVLCEVIGFDVTGVLLQNSVDSDAGLGRVCSLGYDTSVEDVLNKIKNTKKFDYIMYAEDKDGLNKKVNKIGLCTGAMDFEMIYKAKELECDVFISGDMKHHMAQIAKEIGITIIDLGHYCTENIVVDSLKKKLENDFKTIEFITSKVDAQSIRVYNK